MEFFINHEGEIYKVYEFCMCDECQKRGMPELKVGDFRDGSFHYIQVGDLFLDEYRLSDSLDFSTKITREDVVNFLKKQNNIKWFIALNKWINSHIEYLKSMEEIKKHCERR